MIDMLIILCLVIGAISWIVAVVAILLLLHIRCDVCDGIDYIYRAGSKRLVCPRCDGAGHYRTVKIEQPTWRRKSNSDYDADV